LQNNSIFFLSLDEVIEMHKILIKRYGGHEGVRDLGLLESALYRPRTGYYKDLVSMAAALFESLINNHPFVDGNKRVAFFATDVFLRINAYKLSVDGKKAHRFLLKLFDNQQCDMKHLEPWMRDIITRL